VDIEPLRLMAFLHVLLFVYWLGADLGVFLCSARLTRDDLSLDERLRTREIGVALDMAPRTALPLMIPVGFTLAVPYGGPIAGGWLAALWLFTLAWVALVWTVHHRKNEPIGARLQRIDLGIRYVLMVAMAAFGAACLVTGAPIADKWLATKITLFGVIILNGVWLRRIGGRWQAAFDKVRAGGEARLAGERMIKANRAVARVAALLIWFLVAAMAFLGVVKPF
jgi:hypothetical protein